MASKTLRLRKSYEFKIGKNLTDKLSDAQISLLSKYYNSLSEAEQRNIDNNLFKGASNDLLDMAKAMSEETEETPDDPSPEPSSAPPSSSALVPIGTKGTDLVEEKIDERVLAILGLQDTFDFTYEEYLTLLKENAVSARMTQQGMPTESVELITDELKRVKGKTGKFKVKAKKINIGKVVNRTGQATKPSVQLDPTKLLPPSISDSQEEQQEVQKDILDFLKNDLLDALKSINSVVTDILDVLKEQRAINKKKAEQDRKNAEVEKKRKREEKLEGDAGNGMSSLVSTIAKPFTSFFDTIKNFFMNILMGSAINFLLAVIKDPSIILTPLKNFANMIIGFLNGIISFMWNMIVSPINFVINGINSGIQGLINQINNAIRLIPGAKPITALQIPTVSGPPQIPTFPVQQQEGGGETIKIGDISLMSGGGVDNKTGMKVSGFGKDTQLTALSPGEVVFSNPAANFWGRDNLLAMNAMGGGTNKPKFGSLGSIQTMQGGGLVANQGLPSKGILIAPGHYKYGGGTAGTSGVNEYKANRIIGMRIVELVKQMNPDIPIRFYEHPGPIEDSNKGLSDMANTYQSLEKQGYEVIEIHHDQPGGRSGLIPGKNVSPIEAALAGSFGNFGKGYRGGLAMPDRNVSILEMRDLSGAYQRGLGSGDLRFIDSTSRKAAQAILSGYGGTRPNIAQPSSAQPRVAMLPVPVGGGQQAPTSSATPSQPDVPGFSPEDPMNISTLVVKAIYNMVG
jgi:hypothetical protein